MNGTMIDNTNTHGHTNKTHQTESCKRVGKCLPAKHNLKVLTLNE